jgi:hypothetical protein
VDHPKSWLRYVDADKVDDQSLDIDGMKVRNAAGDRLGEVDGVIVDARSGRTYYIAVNAGGWFKTRQFLLPIGEVRLDSDHDSLVVPLTKEQVGGFPGFDKDVFDKLTDADIKHINDETCRVFDAAPTTYAADEPYDAAWNRAPYRYPDWWTSEPTLPDRMGASAFEKVVEYPPSSAARGRREQTQKERRAAVHDTSPHFDGRAQPGDVLGVETGGEQTHIGDTKEDEDRRRQAADDAARKQRDDDSPKKGV